jgi:hypothetical protein
MISITTEEAELLAQTHDLVRFTLGMKAPEHDLTSAALRSLAAERDKAQGYLSRCLQALYPNIEPLPDLLGVCTQIDNVLAGQKAENARLREALRPFTYTGNVQIGYRVKLNGQEPPPITASEEEAWAHYGGSEFHYQQWLQWRAYHMGKELLGETQ